MRYNCPAASLVKVSFDHWCQGRPVVDPSRIVFQDQPLVIMAEAENDLCLPEACARFAQSRLEPKLHATLESWQNLSDAILALC